MFLIIVEIFLRLGGAERLDHKVISPRVHQELKAMSAFYQHNFCGPVHKTQAGEQLMAACIDQGFTKLTSKLKSNQNVIWTLGASTTSGNNCNSETSWPKELNKNHPNFKILNLAEDGLSMRDTYNILAEKIRTNNFPNLLILATPNSSQDFILEELFHNNGFLWRVTHLLLIIDNSLKEYYLTYKYISIWLEQKFTNINNELRPNHKIKSISKKYFSKIIDTTLWQQDIYLKKISDLRLRHNFSILCINMPYVRSLRLSPLLSSIDEYNSAQDLIQSRILKICKNYGNETADIQACFKKYELHSDF